MVTLRELVFALVGAGRLATLDARGLSYFDRDLGAARRSFFAAVLVLPLYLFLVAFQEEDVLAQVSLWRFVVVEALAYVIGWTAYVALMADLVPVFHRQDKYFGFVCVYNWTKVLQTAVYALVVVVVFSGLFSPDVNAILFLAATTAVIVYQWFVTRITLEIGPVLAVALVFLDLAIAVMLSVISETIIERGA